MYRMIDYQEITDKKIRVNQTIATKSPFFWTQENDSNQAFTTLELCDEAEKCWNIYLVWLKCVCIRSGNFAAEV